MRRFQSLIFFATVAWSLDLGWAQCYGTKWSSTREYCKDNYVEIYSNQDKQNQQWSTTCCQEGSQDAKNQQLYADQCQATQCFPSYASTYPLCDMGRPYRLYVDNKEVEFEETVSGQCKGVYGNQDEIGVTFLCCAKNSTETLITTLYGAEPHEFPHYARLGNVGCGGTLYNKKWVLSAAHCVINKATYKVWTKEDPEWEDEVGSVSINIDMEKVYTPNKYKVKSITVHPKTSFFKPADDLGTSYYDVALLELEDEVQFNENVKALRIAKKGFDPLKYGSTAVIVGFGTTDTRRLSKKLQKANLKIRKKDDIFNRNTGMSHMVKYKAQLLPLGGIVDGTANPLAGTGDSGGPAICRDENGEAVLCGVTSFTIPYDWCLDSLNETYCMPAVYNDVQFFADWIKSIAGEQDENTLFKRKLFGSPAPAQKYTSQVHITSTDGTKCGGTLLAKDLVLTSAHCVITDSGFNKPGLKVTGGLRDLKDADDTSDVANVKNSADLPGFERAQGKGARRKRVISLVLETWRKGLPSKPQLVESPYYRNDLAIVKLTKPLKNGTPVTIGGLVESNKIANEVAFPKPNDYGQELSIREMRILDSSDCQKRLDRLSNLGYNIKLEDNVMCGVETYSGGSLCDRELGGGLFCNTPRGKEVLCGVQAFRTCEFNIPNVYIDLRKTKPWTDAAINALK